MNYSDFPDLQQDEWSLTRPTFPTLKGGMLTVVGWSGRIGTGKAYIVECSDCKKDSCLYGDGVFKTLKQSLNKGAIPCGCSRGVRWSQKQYEVLIKRILKGSKLKFLGFADDGVGKGGAIKVRVFCPEHGECNKTKISKALEVGIRCPSCSIEGQVRTRRLKKPNSEKDILESTPKNYTLRKSDKKSGSHYMIQVECSICAEDMYAKAGLCDGIFYATAAALRRKVLPCRCSKSPRYTDRQLTYRANKVCFEMGYRFTGWVNKPSPRGGIRYICKVHGVQTGRLDNMENGQGCPVCVGKNQQQCYINTVLDDSTPIGIKFGISKNSGRRLKEQNNKNLFQMNQVAVFNFPSVKACKGAEKACKDELVCGILSSRELKDGHTETTSLQNIERVIEIYKRFGGVRVELPN